jgi:DNA-binding transcriptional MerR regulator
MASSALEGQVMLIGEVAHRSGVSAKALRYYEDVGLLEPPERDASGYRHYHEAVLDRLRFVRSAQALGLTLGEIRGIVALRDDGEAPCRHVLELLRGRSSEIERTIRELRTLRAELKRLVARAQQLEPAACDPQRVCHLIGPHERVSQG